MWRRWNHWLVGKKDLLSAWASLLGIIAFPAIVITFIIGYFQLKTHLVKPDLHLEFITPTSLSFYVVNSKNVLAEEPLYWFGFIDLDSPPVTIPPIPSKKIPYTRGNARQGPTALMSQYGKEGHRYFGFAGIQCKNCERTRRYWIFFTHGKKTDAWITESEEDDPPFFLNPLELLKDPKKWLEARFPDNDRIPIK